MLVIGSCGLLVFVVVPLLIIVAEEDGVGEVVVGDRGDRELRLIPADAARGAISEGTRDLLLVCRIASTYDLAP